MKRQSTERGQAIVFIVILLAILAGGYWMLLSSRNSRQQDAQRFAREAAQKLVLQQDMHFLNQNLTSHAQVLYPPSWRDRFFEFIRNLGPVQGDFDVHGRVTFTSEFFDPNAVYHADFNTSAGPASIELHFSRPASRWEIDALNLTWTPPPTPTPAAVPIPTLSATPSPSPKPRSKK